MEKAEPRRDRQMPPKQRKPDSSTLILPKSAVARLKIGQSFAEYDAALLDPDVYVHTPAFNAALDPASGKFFFVGRRGTGKTSIRTYCAAQAGHTAVVVPEIFSPSSSIFDLDLLENARGGPFRSLVSVFRRTLIDELLVLWKAAHPTYASLSPVIADELAFASAFDFDERTLEYIAEVACAVRDDDGNGLVSINKTTKTLTAEAKPLQSANDNYTLLIDSIDDFWDGSDLGIKYLTALVHACLEVSTQLPWARVLLFLRENIFERVRANDPESSRIETAVVGLDWSSRHLLELVERRLNRTLTAKYTLGGPVWDAFFEQPSEAKAQIFGYCHNRPRDILIYVSHAVYLAQERGHEVIRIEDVEGARRRFSDNRFKDLGDEYAENYPNIAVVLRRFYGLGRRYTPGGIESIVSKLLVDPEVARLCKDWIFEYQDMVQFVRLLYNIGFFGLRVQGRAAKFRALGPQETSPPAVTDETEIEIHKCYWDALDLQDVLVKRLPEDRDFGRIGELVDLPDGLDPTSYADQLEELMTRLVEIPIGSDGASDFEDAVGDLIRLCFFRALENVQPRSRTANGVVIRDWIASNRAYSGFWSVIRQRYNATQIIWECKNYEVLKADDFHQVSYYSSKAAGRFTVVAFRGEVHAANYEHLRRMASEFDTLMLPLGIRDLKTFVRQSLKGKIKETHIQERYDDLVRRIS